MKTEIVKTIIIGAGHAGLSASYFLKQAGVEHLVLERGKVGESWRSQRWDSFVLNTSNSFNLLPGDVYTGDDPHGFSHAKQFVASLDAYVSKFQLPVLEQTEVLSVEKGEGEIFFSVAASQHGIIKKFLARQVVICSGSQNKKIVPPLAANLPPGILQLHASEYRNASQLPDGSVLVVGSAQSGCQVAEDLIDAGRKVYLSTSLVGRLPRSYRGKDIMEWLRMIHFFDVRPEDVPDPQMLHMKAPQLTGKGGHSISLQYLAQRGATILGKMEHADENKLSFQLNAPMHVQFADGFSQKVKSMIDEFILGRALEAPVAETDPGDMPDPEAACASAISMLNLEEHNIRCIIWATGFKANFRYIKLPVLNNEGNPVHQDGLSSVEGLYFLGLPWLRTRKSGIIYGTQEDAAFISEKVREMCEFAHHPLLPSNIL